VGRPGSFLIVSALVPYKKIDVAIAACRAAGGPLNIVGSGPELARLQRLAGPDVQFLGWRSNEEIRELYQQAAAVLLPGVEDFGMVPVEAQACGCPVVALGAGGACETVVDGETGVLVPDGSVEALSTGLQRARTSQFDPAAIRRHALRFSRDRFKTEFSALVQDALASGARGQGPGAGTAYQPPSAPQGVHDSGYRPRSRPTK
jgi:glycosyltransferase involved in cell wall biosynthesis